MPIVSVLNILLSNGSYYTITKFPPSVCATEDLNFFTISFPLNIVATIGMSMFIVIGWIVYRVRKAS